MKFLVLGTLALACATACGVSSKCDRNNCLGCCSATGQCQLGGATDACGTNGNTCVLCPLGSTCSSGACVGVTAAGGGSSTLAGGGTAGGSTGGGATGGGTGSTGGGSSTARATAFQVSVAMSTLNQMPVTCFLSGRLPTTPIWTGPATVAEEWLFIDTPKSFVVIPDNSVVREMRLGDAPVMRADLALEGTAGVYAARKQTDSQGPSERGRSANERRIGQWRFTLDRTNSTGQLEFSSTYACSDRGLLLQERCPTAGETPANDAASCSLTLPVTLQQVQLLPAWARPRNPAAGSTYFHLMHHWPSFVGDPTCYVSRRLPTSQFSSTWFDYELAERAPTPSGHALRIARTELRLGESPRFFLSELPATSSGFLFERTTNSFGPVERGRNARETRAQRVDWPFVLTNGSAQGNVSISSTYACADNGTQLSDRCPVAGETPADDAASCTHAAPYFAVEHR